MKNDRLIITKEFLNSKGRFYKFNDLSQLFPKLTSLIT